MAPSLFGVVLLPLPMPLVVAWLEPASLGSAGSDPLCRTGQLAFGPDRRRLRQLAAGDGAFIALVVPTQDRARTGRGGPAGPGLPGTPVFRALYVIPWICSPLAVAVLWR